MKILLATDFSDNALNAFQFARHLAQNHAGSITLLFAFTPIYDFAAQVADYIITVEKQAKKELKALEQSAKADGITTGHLIKQETASSAICAEAKSGDYDLVIVGSHGENKIRHAFLGSTTSEVIKHCPKPVMCIPQGASFHKIESISLAMELNKEDIIFLGQLIMLTKEYHLPYKIIHIKKEEEEVHQLTFFELSSYLKDRFPQLTIQFEEVLAHGVNKGLLNYLEQNSQTMLSMFSRHHGFFDYLFNKSHCAEMALQTTVPLLVLK
ncbi:hypothetical protein GCM10028791_06500 [Echinicola sediminis]